MSSSFGDVGGVFWALLGLVSSALALMAGLGALSWRICLAATRRGRPVLAQRFHADATHGPGHGVFRLDEGADSARKQGGISFPGRAANPYCAFRNDQERRKALMSRDVRIVIVAAIAAVAALISKAGAWLPLLF